MVLCILSKNITYSLSLSGNRYKVSSCAERFTVNVLFEIVSFIYNKMSINGVQDPSVLVLETVWLDASKLQEAETRYQEYLANLNQVDVGAVEDVPKMKQTTPQKQAPSTSLLVSEIENVRSKIQKFMKAADSKDSVYPGQLVDRLVKVEQENAEFRKTLAQMSSDMQGMLKKLHALDLKVSKSETVTSEPEKSSVKAVNSIVKNGTAGEDDDDVDLFGSDEETEDERRVKEERLKAYENKKAKKAQVVAKSSVVLDVKPWSDETDLKEMETNVRKIESVGLKWGAAKLVPLAYGIKKLQIIAIVEDDNCSIDWLQEQIEAIDDLVQSVDIAAFNKL